MSRKKQDPVIENGEDVIRAMFSIDGVAAAIQRSGFDVEEEVTMYIDIARNSLEDNTRLAALQRLNRRVREVAEVNGMISTGSVRMVSHEADGTLVEQTRSESRLLSQVRNFSLPGKSRIASRVLPPASSGGEGERGPAADPRRGPGEVGSDGD
jgi:hypothetical protein